MSAPTNPTQDLTGKKIGCWFEVAYAGQRGEDHYWRCMCRASLAEKVIPERDILDRKVNEVSVVPQHWGEACDNPTGWIYGEWTVVGPAGGQAPPPPGPAGPVWRCRCACGAERDIPQSALMSVEPPTLSCGCRPDAEARAELRQKKWQAREGWAEACGAARRRRSERKLDKKWTRHMERALRSFQRAWSAALPRT
jgi:hypothetical protein